MKEDAHFSEQSSLPRVINKLTMCVYPMAIIVPHVSDLTGLDNYNLSGQSNFNRTTVELISTDSLPGIKEVFQKMTDSYSAKIEKTKEKSIVEKEIEIASELNKAGKFET